MLALRLIIEVCEPLELLTCALPLTLYGKLLLRSPPACDTPRPLFYWREIIAYCGLCW